MPQQGAANQRVGAFAGQKERGSRWVKYDNAFTAITGFSGQQ